MYDGRCDDKSVLKKHARCVEMMKRCSGPNNQSLHGMTNHKPRYTVTVMNSGLGSPLKLVCIGHGDDGRVLKAMRDDDVEYAMKVYLKNNQSEVKDIISRDQAYREFKALKLIGKHPNFLKLFSDKLEECYVQEEGHFPYDAWVIRFSYVSDSMPIDKFWFHMGMVYVKRTPCVDMTSTNIMAVHIVRQILSALAYMREKSIRHRDLDGCNILIQFSSDSVHVYFVDFGRADLPDAEATEHTESPNLKLDSGKHVSDEYIHCIREAYQVPHTINPDEYILEGKEPSDFSAVRTVLVKCIVENKQYGLLTYKARERYLDNCSKLLLFLEMIFLIENDESIKKSIDLTTVDPSLGDRYVQEEIVHCFETYKFLRGKDIMNTWRGMGSVGVHREKKRNNVVDVFWDSLECSVQDITDKFEILISRFGIKSGLVVSPEDRYYLKNIMEICEAKRKELKDTAQTSNIGRNDNLLLWFEVEKMATWAWYSDVK